MAKADSFTSERVERRIGGFLGKCCWYRTGLTFKGFRRVSHIHFYPCVYLGRSYFATRDVLTLINYRHLEGAQRGQYSASAVVDRRGQRSAVDTARPKICHSRNKPPSTCVRTPHIYMKYPKCAKSQAYVDPVKGGASLKLLVLPPGGGLTF